MSGEMNIIERLFGENSSGDPRIVIPVVFVAFVILIVIAFRLIIKDKGKSDMTEEELEKDRELLDKQLYKRAEYLGEEYVPERAREAEAAEIAEARRRHGGAADGFGEN